jgi:hypothetical protein
MSLDDFAALMSCSVLSRTIVDPNGDARASRELEDIQVVWANGIAWNATLLDIRAMLDTMSKLSPELTRRTLSESKAWRAREANTPSLDWRE